MSKPSLTVVPAEPGQSRYAALAAALRARVVAGEWPPGSALPAEQTCTGSAPILRSYHSFTQAADENGLSRILVGFHFRKAVVEGIAHGRKIADRAVDRAMQQIGE